MLSVVMLGINLSSYAEYHIFISLLNPVMLRVSILIVIILIVVAPKFNI